MTDQSNDTQEPQEVSPSPSQAQNSEHMIPKSRFDEINEERKALQARLEAIEAEQKKRQEAELTEQQKWQELAEQRRAEIERLQSASEQAQTYQSALEATNKSRIEQIPEDRRHLVPEFDDPVKLGAWLDKALPDLVAQGKPSAPKLDGGSGVPSKERSLPAGVENVAEMVSSQFQIPIDRERLANRVKGSKANQ